jgi:hypothetical protein
MSQKEYNKEYYRKNKESLLKKQKEERYQEYYKEYRQRPEVKERERERARRRAQTPKGRFRDICRGAKSRNIKVDITLDEYEKLYYTKDCYYCGEKESSGLDRLDNTIGYILDNCVTSCTWCNKMKLDKDLDLFYKKIASIYENRCKTK